jgi:hypothetical protein
MRMAKSVIVSEQKIVNSIYLIRGKKVMLDRDLAAMYGVETRILNQAVKRNIRRFPDDFMFQLTEKEWADLMSQIVISSSDKASGWGGVRKMPFVFTEQVVAMLSSVLNSETAIDVNIQIVRIFTKMREMLVTQKDILLKLENLERKILKQDDRHKKHEEEIQIIFKALKRLLNPELPPRKRIGFKP